MPFHSPYRRQIPSARRQGHGIQLCPENSPIYFHHQWIFTDWRTMVSRVSETDLYAIIARRALVGPLNLQNARYTFKNITHTRFHGTWSYSSLCTYSRILKSHVPTICTQFRSKHVSHWWVREKGVSLLKIWFLYIKKKIYVQYFFFWPVTTKRS